MGEVQMTTYEHDACGDAPRAIARLDDGIPLCVTAREKIPPMEGVSSFLMNGQQETHFRVGATKRAGGSDATSEAPKDPVCTVAGNTYDRVNISAWFRTHNTDPVSGTKLNSKKLVPNNLLRRLIADALDKRGGAQAE